MSVKGTFKLDNPSDMQATMQVTMTVGEWERIAKDIEAALVQKTLYPCTRAFRTLVTDLVDQADETFYAEGDGT